MSFTCGVFFVFDAGTRISSDTVRQYIHPIYPNEV